MEELKDNNRIINIGALIAVCAIFVGMFMTYYWLSPLDFDDRGTFGDMFGSINALFSGLALAGIIYTILLQRKELEYQRKELALTRKEFKQQNLTLTIQRFENTLFKLLENQNQILNSITYIREEPNHTYLTGFAQGKTPGRTFEYFGRDAFRVRYEELFEHFRSDGSDSVSNSDLYQTFWLNIKDDFAHYFRHLNEILETIDNHDFISVETINDSPNNTINKEAHRRHNLEQKLKYTSIVRSQLSNHELLWLHYYIEYNESEECLILLVRKYDVLKNIPTDKFLVPYEKNNFEYKD